MLGNSEWQTRRSVLRTGAVAVGTAGLVGRTAGQSSVTTVSGGGTALQSASDGETTRVVDSADCDPITVETTAEPTIVGVGGTGAAVSIEADGVDFKGFRVTNDGGLLGVKVRPGYDDAGIVGNRVENVGPTGRLGVTGIIVGRGDHDSIEIVGNTIRNLDQETTDDSGFPTVNGILSDADNDSPGTVSNIAIANNRITGVGSDTAILGVVVRHVTDGMDLVNDAITDLTAADETDSDQSDGADFDFVYAQGINVASPRTSETVVVDNLIERVTNVEAILPEAVKVDGDGSGLTFRANRLLAAVELNNRNGERTNQGAPRDPSGDPVIDAKNNYWGSPRGPEEADFNTDADDDRADVTGEVEHEPFLRRPPGGRGQGGTDRQSRHRSGWRRSSISDLRTSDRPTTGSPRSLARHGGLKADA